MFHILCSIIAENLVKEVNKKIFHGLVNLKTLSLYSNKISCVTPGAFDALGKDNLSEIINLSSKQQFAKASNADDGDHYFDMCFYYQFCILTVKF